MNQTKLPSARHPALLLAAVLAAVPAAAGSTPPPSPDQAETGAPSSSPASAAGALTLEVHASGFRNEAGHAVGALFAPGANVLDQDEALARVVAPIQDGRADLRFEGLAEGVYALVVFHDENDDGIVNHNVLHAPSEQLGFSRGFRPTLVTGLPTFEKLQFALRPQLGGAATVLDVVVR